MNNEYIENSKPTESADLYLQKEIEDGVVFNMPKEKEEPKKVISKPTVSGNSIVKIEDIDNSEFIDIFKEEKTEESNTNEEIDVVKEEYIKSEKERLLKEKLEKEKREREEKIKEQDAYYEKLENEKSSFFKMGESFLNSAKSVASSIGNKKKNNKTKNVEEKSPDVSDEKPAEKTEDVNWKEVATIDTLTGLQNQFAYQLKIKETPLTASIIFVDANNLKYLNDNFGHEVGNELLFSVANALKSSFKNVYRIGGDEFVVITEERGISKKIKEVEKTIEKDGSKKKLPFSASIGYHTGDGKTDLNKIKEQADKNMYREKEKYKKAHPELDMRSPKSQEKSKLKKKKEKKRTNIDDVSKSLKNIDDFEAIKKDVPTDTKFVLSIFIIQNFENMSKYNGEKNRSLIENIIVVNSENKDNSYYLGNGEYVVNSNNIEHNKALMSTISSKCEQLKIPIIYNTIAANGSESIEGLYCLNKEILEKKIKNNNPAPKKLTYDERLTHKQQDIKKTVQNEHTITDTDEFSDIIDKISVENDNGEILSILLASGDFDTLFVFLDIDNFITLCSQNFMSIDYSYIYVTKTGGSQYFGQDSYHSEITELFQVIAEKIHSLNPCTKQGIEQIEDINIFKNIYIDGAEVPEEHPHPSRLRRKSRFT